MSPLSDRATPQQPLPLSSFAAILGFNPTPYSLSLRRAVPPCRKLFSLLTFNLLAFNVLRHLTSFFSATSALFSAMAADSNHLFSMVCALFPIAWGGVGQRMNVRSILRVRDARSLGVLARHPSLATRLPVRLLAGHSPARRGGPLLPE